MSAATRRWKAHLTTMLAPLVLVTLGFFSPHRADAAQGDIIARIRSVSILPDVKTSGTLSTLGVGVNPSTVPELDFTYMVRNHIGVELILGTARHKVTSNVGSLGQISHLPPTLTLQWHFNPAGRIRPYAGVGVNYTLFYDNHLNVAGEGVGVRNHSFGPALQAGVDVQVSKRFFVNLDVKKLWIKTDATLGGQPIGTLEIDPWVVGFGVGMKF
ncbi:outer membrane protein [Robbsia andropogonis]|uniref:OmpW/AlkL family protein n=1 Tax=Robbsia andropogonis TaxID=28092 RepID=UPI0009E5532A|nr:OmpW family outer membrane protein [Robbsia andropogonis]MCP1118983.1 outer membrane beta-barrel protein [Robbsia andropogonis]MCP1128665.1 outer membrane beta-barrel protein [Robbsia andropogonis]